MSELETEVKIQATSKTKMAIAIGLVGLSAFAAGFAGLRARNLKPDIVVSQATANTEDNFNKFSITLQNKGAVSVTSPFVLNISLGEHKNVVNNIKVLNPVSNDVKGSYENLESKYGSFDILVKNFKLEPGQSTTLTYWFVIPESYEATNLPFSYTWDTTNNVNESSENNTYKGSFDIEKMGLIKEKKNKDENGSMPVENTEVATSTPEIVSTSTPASATTSQEPLPDLVIEDFNISSSTYSGKKQVTVRIKNIGNATANRSSQMYQNLGTFVVQLYFLKDNGEVSILNNYVDSQIYYSQMSLAANKELTIKKDIKIDDSYFINYDKIKMKVDWLDYSIILANAPFIYPGQGYILESNEDNNEMTKEIR